MPASKPGETPGSTVNPRSRGGWLVVVALVALVAVAAVTGGDGARAYLAGFAGWVAAFGPWAPVVFITGYVVATVALFPASLLTLAAGALFGVGRGMAFVFIGATLGATAAFLVARYVARAAVARRLAGHPRLAAIDSAMATSGRRVVLLLRLSPLVPFTLLNYALGLTQVRLLDFVMASVGMLPGTLLYVYYGKLAGDVAALATGATPPRGAAHYAVLALGLVATVVATTIVTRAAQRALAGVVE